MKIVFFGTSSFSVTILEHIVEAGHTIAAIVTRPDAPKKRSSKPLPPPVKEWAHLHLPAVNVYQPVKASSAEFVSLIQKVEADVFVVASYGEIMSQELLDACKIFPINVHASLLPKWRGAAPIQRSIMAGEKESGVTIMKMVRKMDAGDMLAKVVVEIQDTDDHGSLQHKLAVAAKEPLLQVLEAITQPGVIGQVQENKEVTFAAKIESHEAQINWGKPAEVIWNQIRALSPDIGAWTWVEISGQRKRMKIWKALLIQTSELAPYESAVNHGKEWLVGCIQGSLSLQQVQFEGKKRLNVEEALRGAILAPRVIME